MLMLELYENWLFNLNLPCMVSTFMINFNKIEHCMINKYMSIIAIKY